LGTRYSSQSLSRSLALSLALSPLSHSHIIHRWAI
jgi:hypothetical protein